MAEGKFVAFSYIVAVIKLWKINIQMERGYFE